MNPNEKPRLIQLVDAGVVPDHIVRRIVPSYSPGCYVHSYDPEVGLGSLVCTLERRRALRLSGQEAFDLWLSAPSSEPIRLDGSGKPNRPLTAFTVNFEVVEFSEAGRWP